MAKINIDLFSRLKKKMRQWLNYPAVYAGKALLRTILFTCRIEIRGLENFVQTVKNNRTILMLWHNRLVILPEILNKYTPNFTYRAVISKSRDGEILALLTHSYKGGKVLRVPHDARFQALTQMIKQLKETNEVIVLTPDGPRGPKYQMKPGAAIAAIETRAAVVPFSWKADRFWQLGTWDNMMIPKPFSQIEVVFGNSLSVSEENIETAVATLQAALMNT